VIELLLTVKIGGSTLQSGISTELVQDLKERLPSEKTVLVHGGARTVTDVATRLNKEQRFVVSPRGFRSRYTDKQTAEIYTMVMSGRINKQIVLTLQSQGIPAVGLSGLDGLLIQAERKKRLIAVDETGRKRIVDGGYTGKISKVNGALLALLLDKGYFPVVAPVAVSEEFEPLNVDGDRAAAYVAGSVKADRLVLLTDVDGVTLHGKVIARMSLSEAKDKLGDIGAGMITKMYAAMEALEMGVDQVVICSGFGKRPISSALANECGTVIQR
jgi:acetylglutamate/LysW-gamma-L-alpha-aminoadipate kinase